MSTEATTVASTATTDTGVSTGTTTTTVAEPWYKDWVQSDGTLNHKSLERLPDHLKPLKETWSRQKTIDDIGTSTVHFQSLAAKKALAPLPENAPENIRLERKALLDSMGGVPKEPKDYGISKPKDLPDSAWNQPLADGATTWAHKHSVSPAALRELVDMNLGLVKGQLDQQAQYEQQFWTKEQQAFDATIKRENIDSQRANNLVEKGAIALGLDIQNEQTKNFLKGSDARLMAMRHALAIGEDKVITGQGGDGGGGKDYAAQAMDIQRNQANPEYAVYHNREGKFSRSQQEAVVSRVNEMLRLAADKASGKVRR